MFILRNYQQSAVDAAIAWIRYKPNVNGYITSPGGSGKSVMIAAVASACFEMSRRVIILARNEKLLRQNRAKFSDKYQPHISLYCAGLGEKDLSGAIIVGSIQSLASIILPNAPALVLVDEAQNIHPDSDSETQYWDFFKANGNPQIIGFTATPFRTSSGKIQWGEEIINIPIQPLIESGYLVAPKNKATTAPDTSVVSITLGEFNQTELAKIYEDEDLLLAALEKIKEYSTDRNSVLIFCQSVAHARLLHAIMLMNDMEGAVVDGETPKDQLATILDDFENRKFKYLLNCNLLAEGYDAPCVDMVAIIRSTMSKGLFEQIVYRGCRPYPGKKDFLLLDMGGNLSRHGALGSPYREKAKREKAQENNGKICPRCEEFTLPLARECPDCGFQFPEPEARKASHDYEPDDGQTIFMPITTDSVADVVYRAHRSKTGNTTIKVMYHLLGGYDYVAEYLSPWSANEWAKNKAKQFFIDRGWDCFGDIALYSMDDLLFHAQKLKKPTKIVVNRTGKWPEIKSYIWGSNETGGKSDTEISDILGGDEIPF